MQRIGLLALALLAAAPAALAQESYPNRPIRLVVPSSPGGVHDIIGRVWAEKLKTLGTIVIENRAGAAAIIGTVEVARAPADGYTLLLGSNSTHVLQPLLMSKPAYDPVKDFEVVTVIAATSTSIGVHPAQPFRTLKELIDFARANPGKLSYAHGGVGGSTHVTGELLKQLAGGIDIVQVPYKGVGPAMSDVISGHVPVLFANITSQVIELNRTGKLRILAVNAPARHDGLPDVPTAIEAGVPNMVSQSFFGVFAPAGTPKAVLERVNAVTQAAMADREFLKRLSDAGYEPLLGLGPDKAKRYIREEYVRWTPILQGIGKKE
jgi:tripartite-type tricarboxylate transporter receptor subunit TctC